MTKTKKRNVVAGIAALSLACCVAGGIAVGGGYSFDRPRGQLGTDRRRNGKRLRHVARQYHEGGAYCKSGG